jgi:hypothetical protein
MVQTVQQELQVPPVLLKHPELVVLVVLMEHQVQQVLLVLQV